MSNDHGGTTIFDPLGIVGLGGQCADMHTSTLQGVCGSVWAVAANQRRRLGPAAMPPANHSRLPVQRPSQSRSDDDFDLGGAGVHFVRTCTNQERRGAHVGLRHPVT